MRFAVGSSHPQQLTISADIVSGHSCVGESLFKSSAHHAAVVRQDCRKRRDGFILAVDHLAGDAILDDLGDRPAAEREHRRAARHSFDHHESKRLRPIHGKQQSRCLAEEFCFVTLVDLSDELYARVIDERQYSVAEVVFIDLVDFGGDLQWNASQRALF